MSLWNTEKNIDRVKRDSGVYVLYSGRKKLKYVGYSKNMFERLLTHELAWKYVKVKYISVDRAKKLEYRLIKKIKPEFNIRHRKQTLKAEHRIRLLPETYYTLKIASDFSKRRIADIIQDLIDHSEYGYIVSSKKISKQMIKELYEN